MKNSNVLLQFVLSNVFPWMFIFPFPQFVKGDRTKGIMEKESVFREFTEPKCYNQHAYDRISPQAVRASAAQPTPRPDSAQKYDIKRILILGADEQSKCDSKCSVHFMIITYKFTFSLITLLCLE